jgi:hypothetical protein
MRRGTSGVASAITWGDGQAALPSLFGTRPDQACAPIWKQNRCGRSATVKRQRLDS